MMGLANCQNSSDYNRLVLIDISPELTEFLDPIFRRGVGEYGEDIIRPVDKYPIPIKGEGLADDAEIVDATNRYYFDKNVVTLKVHSMAFEPVKELAIIPHMSFAIKTS